MAETLQALVAHLERSRGPTKIVVWEHNSHIGDARATEGARAGELNVGQLVRERHGREALLAGFTTFEGTVTAASDWGGPAERKTVRPALADSWEDLFHRVGEPQFVLSPTEPEGWRLERAIGVIYRPQTERQSHYFEARIAGQFDAVIHIDETHAVEPLERTSEWDTGELPETYPGPCRSDCVEHAFSQWVARVSRQRRHYDGDELSRREALETLVRYYHHVQNEHRRAPEGGVPRRIDRLLAVRDRFDRLLMAHEWWQHLHYRAPEPSGPPAIRPLVVRGQSEAGAVAEIRKNDSGELELVIDGSPVGRLPGKPSASDAAFELFRLNRAPFSETFTAPAAALSELAEFVQQGGTPPWEYAEELLSDGLVDVHFALTPRGRRALASVP